MSLFSLWREYRQNQGCFTPLGVACSPGGTAGDEQAALQPLGGSNDGTEAVQGHERNRQDPAEEALEQGIAEGYRRAKEELASMVKQLEEALTEFTAFRASVEKRYGRQMLEIAIAVAEKILRAELEQKPERWLTMIQEGIRQAIDREKVQIRANPVLYRFLNDNAGKLYELVEEARQIELVEDPAVGDCGCIIETKYGDVDVSLRTQLDAAGSALLENAE